MICQELHRVIRVLLRADYRKRYLALQSLKLMPRYMQLSTEILGPPIKLADGASFISMYGEIFDRQIYRFKSHTNAPVIIDCGANIGLSIIYFGQLYPGCRIVAFEPDPEMFRLLRTNIETFGFSNIEAFNKAVWSSETVLDFMSDGSDGGRVVSLQGNTRTHQVHAVRLRDYLKGAVDLLKLDVEGAETEIIRDCADSLCNVANVFVEYHSFLNSPQTLDTIIKILSEAGFRLHIQSPYPSPQPLYERRVQVGMDMRLNIFAFRV